MRNGKGISLGAEWRPWSGVGRPARAVLGGLRNRSNSLAAFRSASRLWSEPLESRQLLGGSFTVSIAAPATVTAGQQFYIYVWTAGGTMPPSNEYSVDFNDGRGPQPFPWSTTSRVTAIPYTYAYGGTSRTIIVSASTTGANGQVITACQTCGMDDLGNYPDPSQSGGPSTFVPSGATSATPSSIIVDPGTGGSGYTYVAETYNTSGGGHQMALTRLDGNDLPDTHWGTPSGSTYTGTLVVPAFGGGSDVAYAAAVGDQDRFDEAAIAGKSANGMAAAIINLSGTGELSDAARRLAVE